MHINGPQIILDVIKIAIFGVALIALTHTVPDPIKLAHAKDSIFIIIEK
jgi:hypothetical protein